MKCRGEPTDEELMLQVKTGNTASFEELMRRYRHSLYGFVLRMVGDPAMAQDIYQDAFLRVYRYAPKYEPRSAFSTFLYTIASNLAINEIKKRKLWRMIPFMHEEGRDRENTAIEASRYMTRPETPLQSLQRSESQRLVRQAIDTLSASQRLVLVLAEFEGLPYQEIADIAHVPVGTVKSRINRAKAKIKEWMIQHEMPPGSQPLE